MINGALQITAGLIEIERHTHVIGLQCRESGSAYIGVLLRNVDPFDNSHYVRVHTEQLAKLSHLCSILRPLSIRQYNDHWDLLHRYKLLSYRNLSLRLSPTEHQIIQDYRFNGGEMAFAQPLFLSDCRTGSWIHVGWTFGLVHHNLEWEEHGVLTLANKKGQLVGIGLATSHGNPMYCVLEDKALDEDNEKWAIGRDNELALWRVPAQSDQCKSGVRIYCERQPGGQAAQRIWSMPIATVLIRIDEGKTRKDAARL